MTLLATLTLLAQVVSTDTIETGWASQYSKGIMARVIENRQRG
ncbi:MAG: hypothetical protein ACYSVY_00215 [Planctomycetota bacterium]|jgi:hypothetical protein